MRRKIFPLCPNFRVFRFVAERKPISFEPRLGYRLTYYIERLTCGHTHVSFPQAEGPAKRRDLAFHDAPLCRHGAPTWAALSAYAWLMDDKRVTAPSFVWCVTWIRDAPEI